MPSPPDPDPVPATKPEAEPLWSVFREGDPESPVFRIVMGEMSADLPAEWVDVHEQLLKIAGQAGPDEPEGAVAQRRQRLLARCDDSEQYAFATYLKWDCALEMQAAFGTYAELKAWDANAKSSEAFTLLRLEEIATGNEVVGLLLLRWGWSGSVIFEFLNVRADVTKRLSCAPAPCLVWAGLDLAGKMHREAAWVETGPESESRLWSLLFERRLQEIRHSDVASAMKRLDTLLKERNLVMAVSEG